MPTRLHQWAIVFVGIFLISISIAVQAVQLAPNANWLIIGPIAGLIGLLLILVIYPTPRALYLRLGWPREFSPYTAATLHRAAISKLEGAADAELAKALADVILTANADLTEKLVTRTYCDSSLSQLKSRLMRRLITITIAFATVVFAAQWFLA